MAKKPDRNKLKKLTEEKIRLIENSPNKFYSSVAKEQEKLLKELNKLLGELDTKDGVILVNNANLEKIDSITKKIKKSFYKKGGYVDSVDVFVTEMDEVKTLTDQYYKEGFGAFNGAKATALYKTKRSNTIEVLSAISSMDSAIFNPIKQTISDGVTNGTTYKELIDNISLTVTGNDEVDGKLQKYAKQIAGDAFSTTERNYTKEIAGVFNVQFYRYTGGEVTDTRCFCGERNGNYYHVNEIISWGNGENIGGGCGYPWQGMYKETNSGNIMSWLGGYNCKHSLIPVSLILVPEADIIRAIEKGFFKPTKAEIELLQLDL